MVYFEFDPGKEKQNQERHGIDFQEAQRLWDGPHVIIPAKNIREEGRWAILGKIRGKVCIAIFTMTARAIRIISCHRADRRWERIFYGKIKETEKE